MYVCNVIDCALVILLLVASSPLIASISVGGVIGYPNVLLQQLHLNDTNIFLDIDTSSWIGSIHGLAGIPTILMPLLMQWKGRKVAFLTSSLFLTFGWILAYVARTVETVLISESLHGLGSNSLLMISTCSVSEMTDPKFRNTFVVAYIIFLTIGLTGVGILGQYLHWRTVALVLLVPIVIAFVTTLVIWPESPSWLALKGRYTESEQSFKWLRGDSKRANEELKDILLTRKDKVQKESLAKRILRKDFIYPALLMFVLINSMYWNGVLVVIIYLVDIVKKTSGNEAAASYGMISMDLILLIFTTICAFLVRKFNNKTIFLLSTTSAMFCLLFCSIVMYLQSLGYLKGSLLCLYGLLAFISSCALGPTTLGYNMGMEIIPVKHRGIGGAFYVIYTCVLHSSSLKAAPYLFLSIGYWGTFLLYALNALSIIIIVWKFVPETKNRTLQELEDYFNYGKFVKRSHDEENIDNSVLVTDN